MRFRNSKILRCWVFYVTALVVCSFLSRPVSSGAMPSRLHRSAPRSTPPPQTTTQAVLQTLGHQATLLAQMIRHHAKIQANVLLTNIRYSRLSDVVHGISKVGFVPGETLWLLGQQHQIQTREDYSNFRRSFRSIIRFTYRRNVEFNDEAFTTDEGWGCILRASQMLLAQALQQQPDGLLSPLHLHRRQHIITLFLDSNEAIYSIQNMIEASASQKTHGEWFNPSEGGLILQHLVNHQHNRPFAIHVAFQGKSGIPVVNMKEVKGNYGESESVLILIPFAFDNPAQLEKMFQMSQCIGMIGGTHSGHAVYYVGMTMGTHEMHLLDPHRVFESSRRPDQLPAHHKMTRIYSASPRKQHLSELKKEGMIGFHLKHVHDRIGFQRAIQEFGPEFPFAVAPDPAYSSDLPMDDFPDLGNDWKDDHWGEMPSGYVHVGQTMVELLEQYEANHLTEA